MAIDALRTRMRPSCPLCGRDNRSEPMLPCPGPQWGLTRCSTCGLLYLRTVVEVAGLVDEHSWTRSKAVATQERRALRFGTLRFCINEVRKRVIPHRKVGALLASYHVTGCVVDVGCGWGRLFSQFPKRAVPIGIEIDHAAATLAHERAEPAGGHVRCTDALTGLRSLDAALAGGVILESYLEHENEPLAVLAEVRRVLRDCGFLIVKVPNYASWNRRLQGWRWPGFRFPDHVQYFTPETLRAIISRAGFEIARFSWRDRLPTSDNMWLIARKPASGAIVSAAA
jgi:SAM-dependent methyltransferase